MQRNSSHMKINQDVKELFNNAIYFDEHDVAHLRLTERGLSDSAARSIAKLMHENSMKLRTVNLSFNRLGDDAMPEIVEGMRKQDLPAVTSLNFSNNCFQAEQKSRLSKFLLICLNLSELNLSLNHIGDAGARALAKPIPDLKHLLDLDLSINRIRDNGCVALCSALTERTCLRSLSLRMNQLADEAAFALAQLVRDNRTILSLSLSNNYISDSGAIALAFSLDANSTLDELDLAENRIGNHGVGAFYDILCANPSKRLHLLDLVRNPADDEMVERVSQKYKQYLLQDYLAPPTGELEAIELSGKQIQQKIGMKADDVCCKAIFRLARDLQGLVRIDLSNNKIGKFGALQIASFLCVNTSVKDLNVSTNFINDEGAKWVADAMMDNTALVSLDISQNDLKDMGVIALYSASFDNKKSMLRSIDVKGNLHTNLANSIIASVIQARKQLRFAWEKETSEIVDLSHRNLRRYGAAVLRDVFSTNTTCRSLIVSRNNLSDEGAKCIAELVQTNKNITKLDLSANGIGDTGAFAIANMLYVNKSLLVLNLRATSSGPTNNRRITDMGMKAIASALKTNKTLLQLDIRDHTTSTNATNLLLQALHANKTLQKFNGGLASSFLIKKHL